MIYGDERVKKQPDNPEHARNARVYYVTDAAEEQVHPLCCYCFNIAAMKRRVFILKHMQI